MKTLSRVAGNHATPLRGGYDFWCNLKVTLHILQEQLCRLIHSSRLF